MDFDQKFATYLKTNGLTYFNGWLQKRPVPKPDYTIVVFGAPGVGKSTFLNYFSDGYDSGRFKASMTSASGETTKISFQDFCLKRDKCQVIIRAVDFPGFGDINIPIEKLAKQFQHVLQGTVIDMALIVTKANDYRVSMGEHMSLQMLKTFFESVNPRALFSVFTHCDVYVAPDWYMIKERLQIYEEFANIQIPLENIVFFGKSATSLQGFVDRFIQGRMVGRNIEYALPQFSQTFQNVITSQKQKEDAEQKEIWWKMEEKIRVQVEYEKQQMREMEERTRYQAEQHEREMKRIAQEKERIRLQNIEAFRQAEWLHQQAWEWEVQASRRKQKLCEIF